MNKRIYFVLLFFLLMLTIVPSKGEPNNVVFTENFEAPSLVPAKWNVVKNTNYSGYSAYGGSVKLADGFLTLPSDGPSFPFIYSATNPFPTSGDFEIEFAMQYTCIADLSCGVQISNAGTDPNANWDKYALISIGAGDVGNIEDNNTAIGIDFFGARVYQITVPGFKPSTPEKLYKVTCINGTYTLYVDGLFVAEQHSFERPNTIVLGSQPTRGIPLSPEMWAMYSYWGWDILKIDYVKVGTPQSSNSLSFDFGSISTTTIAIFVVAFLAGIGVTAFAYNMRRKRQA